MAEEVEADRVSMQWPKPLKAEVRERVGARGLTEFVLDAVRLHLDGGAQRAQTDAQEINELKWLVQQLADRVAIGGDADVRKSGLMELELPAWIDTSGWPADMAALVKVPVASPVSDEPERQECPQHAKTFHVVGGECPKCREERRAQEREAEEGPAPVAPLDLPHDTQGGSTALLDKVLAKAREKGVELADIGLKPASTIQPPLDKQAEEAIEVMEEVAEVATAKPQVCSKCGDELVDGECWTCEL